MKRYYVLMMAVLMVFSAGVFAQGHVSKGEKLLFLAAAPKAKLVHKQADHYLLMVRNAPGSMAYFTDRPVRKSGLIEVDQFTKLWTNASIKNNFTSNPPNVAVAMLMGDGTKQSFIAVMGKPMIKDKFIVYPLTKISKNSVHSGNSTNTILFIDDVTWNPGGF